MITQFHGEYRWMSNFWPAPITTEEGTFATAEHLYQRFKSDDPEWVETCLIEQRPGKIKALSRKLELPPWWVDIQLMRMYRAVQLKFEQNPHLAEKLLATGNEYLQKGNYWNDVYWGVDLRQDPPVGKNHLGLLLMEVRRWLRDEV